MLKVGFHTLGCKVNQYETDAIIEQFENRGYKIVDFNDIADIYIINTCTVTNTSDKKSRKMLSRAKKTNKEAVVVALGCYAQIAEDKLKDSLGVDLIIGNTKKNQVVDIVEEYLLENKKIIYVEDISKVIPYEDMWISKMENKTRAYIKIQDGCNQFCSYCIIPYTRGRVRSRKPDNALKEVKQLVQKGYKEIVLTGIHLASYGKEFEKYKLIDLLKELNGIHGLERIRLGSLEPTLITENFVKEIVLLEKICPHFHLSLQSGCDETLKRMNRKYTTKDFLQSVLFLKKAYNKPGITTDIIVGFPEESEEEFNQTFEFIRKVEFLDIHIFKYSPRKGTKAASMKGQIDEEIKNNRSKELMILRDKMHINFLKSYIGEDVEVLFEEKISEDKKEYFIGHTSNYMKVKLENPNLNLENKLQKVKIIQVNKDYVEGILSF